jgi:hypothetical protein
MPAWFERTDLNFLLNLEGLTEKRLLARIFHKLSGFSRLARVPEEKLDWTALVFRFRQNLGLIPL